MAAFFYAANARKPTGGTFGLNCVVTVIRNPCEDRMDTGTSPT
jgi:hypothetical protein